MKENSANLLRRFSRRIKEGGFVRKVKSIRYNQRSKSKLQIKTSALKKITKKIEIEKLKRMGKMQ